ncbi:MAG: PQQ-binding-like beta-propeller repeat protein [Alphaproteobacteria bacterium]|nr:PQQ-binding-like beta-propeller repeat protein [Alphaproteobacteria bacterium]
MFHNHFSALAASLIALGVTVFATSPHWAQAAQAKSPTTIDWPHFRFDEKHDGYQRFETTLNRNNVPQLSLLWQADLQGELVYHSSPAVVNGVVYIGEDTGVLWAFPADGCGSDLCTAPLWKSTYLAQIVDSPTVVNGIVYVGSQTSFDSNDGKLNAFAAKGCGHKSECAPLWQGDAGKESILESSPVYANGVIFIGSYGGKLYAFNAEGCGKKLCQPLWTGKMGSTNSTALVYKNVVYIGSNDGHLYAFNAEGCGKKSCNPIWTGDTHGATFDSSPAVANGIVYIGSAHALSAFDASGCGAKTCTALWQAIDDEAFFDASPAIYRGRVYLPWESQINIYDAKGCGKETCGPVAVLFGTGMQDAIASSPTIANGVVYAGRNSGEILAWNADCKGTCDQIWSRLLDDPIVNSSPTVVNGKIYIGGSNHGFSGRLYVLGLAQ